MLFFSEPNRETLPEAELRSAREDRPALERTYGAPERFFWRSPTLTGPNGEMFQLFARRFPSVLPELETSGRGWAWSGAGFEETYCAMSEDPKNPLWHGVGGGSRRTSRRHGEVTPRSGALRAMPSLCPADNW